MAWWPMLARGGSCLCSTPGSSGLAPSSCRASLFLPLPTLFSLEYTPDVYMCTLHPSMFGRTLCYH